MQTGFYSNAGGMVAQFNRLNVVSNNLANLNTSGYKRDDLVIGDYMRLYKEKRDILPIDNHTRDGSKFLNRSIVRVPHVVEEFTDTGIGGLEHTGNSLDLALKDANLYFAVQTPGGVKYTRKGNFVLNENGEIATQEGDKILGANGAPIRLPHGFNINITDDGNIYLNNEQNLQDGGAAVGRIKVVSFDNPKYLKKVGDNYYESPRAEIERTGGGLIAQGFVEKSNVNAVKEMTALIEINRLAGMYQKVMDTQMNELNSDAIAKLATIKA
ncbi:MAG: flagellar basal-body rod protein FlgF [Helicobacteraceae bacterium]